MSEEFITKDSGKRVDFETGATRDVNFGKGYYFCISPHAIERLAKLLERGADKYGVCNYRLGIKLSRYVDSALRHLFQFLEGQEDEDHLAAVLFNISGLIQTQKDIKDGKIPQSIDDLNLVRTGKQKEDFPFKTYLTESSFSYTAPKFFKRCDVEDLSYWFESKEFLPEKLDYAYEVEYKSNKKPNKILNCLNTSFSRKFFMPRWWRYKESKPEWVGGAPTFINEKGQLYNPHVFNIDSDELEIDPAWDEHYANKLKEACQ